MTETERRPPLPPFTEQTAAQKVRMAAVWPAAATIDLRVPPGFGVDVVVEPASWRKPLGMPGSPPCSSMPRLAPLRSVSCSRARRRPAA
jgi:hypothetical protein